MLLCKNGRFYVEGASFSIPNGFYLETEPDVYYENGLFAWNPARTHLYLWVMEENCNDSKKELEELSDSGLKLCSEITPITVNGLSGHWALYKEIDLDYYEARFNLKDGKKFVLIIETKTLDINLPEVEAVLKGIRAE